MKFFLGRPGPVHHGYQVNIENKKFFVPWTIYPYDRRKKLSKSIDATLPVTSLSFARNNFKRLHNIRRDTRSNNSQVITQKLTPSGGAPIDRTALYPGSIICECDHDPSWKSWVMKQRCSWKNTNPDRERLSPRLRSGVSKHQRIEEHLTHDGY